ncbi:transcription factor bHLH111-like isoform X2 [Zingiber officinale]|uniref:transcription factor bHLH111-like isoform X2 n=1 Tax=Zingiber officinale TaxID=94328 RepID=UPI001C4BA71B|nr:transcription factor bHLH111-like isoform X2 [Zingiber officinale]
MEPRRTSREHELLGSHIIYSIVALSMHANFIMAHGAPLLSPSATAPTTSWWENIHTNPLRWPPQSPPSVRLRRSSSSYDESSVSNAAASHCTALSMDSSSGGEPADNHHMWNHLLLNGGEASNCQDDAENFVEVLSSKKLSADQFDPASCHGLMHPSSQLNFLGMQSNSNNTENRYQTIGRVESVLDHPWFSQRNLMDQMPFGGCLNKPDAMEFKTSEPYLKGSDLCGETKQGCQSSSMRGNGRCGGTAEGKRKRPEESSEKHFRKNKNNSQMIPSNKLQVPKAKVAEKISALQQHVSPFGKTDQASVLMETINCIRILQKQVQLLSDPYLKPSLNKERNCWGETERKEKAEARYDLRSKGLCLVPVSSIPQIHRESIRSDCWMPTLRGCFL